MHGYNVDFDSLSFVLLYIVIIMKYHNWHVKVVQKKINSLE